MLNNGSVFDPLTFKAICFFGIGCKDFLPVVNIALYCLNLNSCLVILNFEELDLDNSLRVEALNFVTLLCSINLV